MALKIPELTADLAIVSARLRLAPVHMEYADAIFAEFTPAITTYMFPAPATQIEETRAFIADSIRRRAAGTDLVVAILNQETGEFLGNAGLHDLETAHPVLGIWLKASAHGRRYGVEAIGALIGWARQNAEFEYLLYPVDRRNIPSRHIPESFGGIIASEYKEKTHAGNELDLIEYRIY